MYLPIMASKLSLFTHQGNKYRFFCSFHFLFSSLLSSYFSLFLSSPSFLLSFFTRLFSFFLYSLFPLIIFFFLCLLIFFSSSIFFLSFFLFLLLSVSPLFLSSSFFLFLFFLYHVLYHVFFPDFSPFPFSFLISNRMSESRIVRTDIISIDECIDCTFQWSYHQFGLSGRDTLSQCAEGMMQETVCVWLFGIEKKSADNLLFLSRTIAVVTLPASPRDIILSFKYS